MANTSLPNLTERTATANTDLIHVNSGGTDYKETKANFLSDVNSSITSLNNSLTKSYPSYTVHANVSQNGIIITRIGNVVYVSGYFGVSSTIYGAETLISFTDIGSFQRQYVFITDANNTIVSRTETSVENNHAVLRTSTSISGTSFKYISAVFVVTS